MILYLVRHGKDDETVRGGWSDQPLTAEGICQAEAMSITMTERNIRHIYSSDLPRAMQTAEILAEKLQLPVVPLKQFREVNNGDLAGMKNEEALVRYPGLFWNQLEWEQCYPNGESPKQFYERIYAMWMTFSQKLLVKKENAVLITHGGVIHVIRSILENRLYSNQTKQRKVQYAEVIALTYENGVWKERKDDAMALKELEQENLIAKAESFLKETFAASTYLRNTPKERDYRLEHSYRVANIAKTIAEAEGFDVTNAVIAGLLHDIAYCEEMVTREDWKNHGRRSAAIARPFLESLGLGENAVNEICYGIAIHVDDEADFQWERTPFCETVGDADNIDRFDAYRIYETLESLKFSEMKLEDKREKVEVTIGKLNRFKEMKLGTVTAKNLWLQRLDYYIDFYEKLKAQLDNSSLVSVEVRR